MPSTPYQDTYSAALVIIGNEILSGRTQDTNTMWIAERLTDRGLVLSEVRVIPDIEETIISTVNELRQKYDHVFTTGGIGPTHDDITTESVAKAFGVELERNAEAFRMLEEHYGLMEITAPRSKMSLIPVGATLIPNPVTAAPGFTLENVHVMAGVPRIMQAMFDHILSTIKAGKTVLSNTVNCTISESILAEGLEFIQKQYPFVSLGSYPHFRGGEMGLSLVLRSTDMETLEKATQEVIDLIRRHGEEPRALSIHGGKA